MCGARRLRFRLCCTHIPALFWYGRAVMHLKRSTVYRPPGCAVRTSGRSSVQLGGVAFCGARRGIHPAVLRVRDKRATVRVDKALPWSAGGIFCAERGTLFSRLCCVHVRTHLCCSWLLACFVRSTAHLPTGFSACTHGHNFDTAGRCRALCGACAAPIRLYYLSLRTDAFYRMDLGRRVSLCARSDACRRLTFVPLDSV